MGHVRVTQRVDKFEETHETWSFGIEQTGGPLSPTHTFEKKRKVFISFYAKYLSTNDAKLWICQQRINNALQTNKNIYV